MGVHENKEQALSPHNIDHDCDECGEMFICRNWAWGCQSAHPATGRLVCDDFWEREQNS